MEFTQVRTLYFFTPLYSPFLCVLETCQLKFFTGARKVSMVYILLLGVITLNVNVHFKKKHCLRASE